MCRTGDGDIVVSMVAFQAPGSILGHRNFLRLELTYRNKLK